MILRAKRWLAGCSLLFLIGLAVLIGWEWARRLHVTAAEPESLAAPGRASSAEDLRNQFAQPDEFARLCAEVREHFDALQSRFHRSMHTRKVRVTEFDRAGKATAIMEVVSRVHFDGSTERSQAIERRQILGKPFPFDPDALKAEHPNKRAIPPFSKDAPDGLYHYRLEGVEELQDRRLVRIHYEPTQTVERSFWGSAWIDPSNGEIVRIQGLLAKTPLLVDRFEMLMDYGPSENGHNQVRRILMDMRGGFAFVSRHYRVETDLSEYRESP